MSKTAYAYHELTGEFLGLEPADTDIVTGDILLPAYSVADEPPKAGDNEIAVYKDTAWSVVKDFRGTDYWDELGNKSTITELDVTVPTGALLVEPVIVPTLDEIKAEALVAINSKHSELLVKHSGNSTAEERDTWPEKVLAAKAYSNNKATDIQKEMLSIEAGLSSISIVDLISIIMSKYAEYTKLVGKLSGLRTKAKDAVKAATTEAEVKSAVDLLVV